MLRQIPRRRRETILTETSPSRRVRRSSLGPQHPLTTRSGHAISLPVEWKHSTVMILSEETTSPVWTASLTWRVNGRLFASFSTQAPPVPSWPINNVVNPVGFRLPSACLVSSHNYSNTMDHVDRVGTCICGPGNTSGNVRTEYYAKEEQRGCGVLHEQCRRWPNGRFFGNSLVVVIVLASATTPHMHSRAHRTDELTVKASSWVNERKVDVVVM